MRYCTISNCFTVEENIILLARKRSHRYYHCKNRCQAHCQSIHQTEINLGIDNNVLICSGGCANEMAKFGIAWDIGCCSIICDHWSLYKGINSFRFPVQVTFIAKTCQVQNSETQTGHCLVKHAANIGVKQYFQVLIGVPYFSKI